jgi:hypothetical protein
MTDHLVESSHRIWGGIFDADKGGAQYPFSEHYLQFSSVRPLQIMESSERAFEFVFLSNQSTK